MGDWSLVIGWVRRRWRGNFYHFSDTNPLSKMVKILLPMLPSGWVLSEAHKKNRRRRTPSKRKKTLAARFIEQARKLQDRKKKNKRLLFA